MPSLLLNFSYILDERGRKTDIEEKEGEKEERKKKRERRDE